MGVTPDGGAPDVDVGPEACDTLVANVVLVLVACCLQVSENQLWIVLRSLTLGHTSEHIESAPLLSGASCDD